MARSKFNRKHSTGAQPLQRKSSTGAAPSQGLIGSTSPKETLEAIDYHFDHLNSNLKSFLLSDPNSLNLKRFVDFWSSPENSDSTSPSVAASICGCSWYLGMNYLSIGMLAEARALTLNGCFLQQCYNTPIADIAALCSDDAPSTIKTSLPFFNDGLLAISTQQRLAIFLKSKVTTDYQRRMAFATRTAKSKSQVKDYINQIGSDWNETPGGNNKAKAFRKRASTGMNVDSDKFIDITLIDAHTKEETNMRCGISFPLKLIIKRFADEHDLPLKKLRFSYKGKNLFLSSLGQKTSQDLGISHLDSIFVHNKDTSDDEATSSSSSDESSKENRRSPPAVVTPSLKKFKPFSRKNSHTPCAYVLQEEQDRRNHSRKLSQLFEEAEPRFKEIRQKLADLSIECQPKGKSRSQKRIQPSRVQPIDNPCTVGQGGKAGVPFYVVHVGETDNLYKTRHTHIGRKNSLSIDLHGYTRAQAIEELDTKLPEWVNTAQRGQYPFVVPVTIICGGGNQILSEAVDDWIKSKDNVANAPKKKFNRRVSY
jgi:DNA-nicking Smr family endonuclease